VATPGISTNSTPASKLVTPARRARTISSGSALAGKPFCCNAARLDGTGKPVACANQGNACASGTWYCSLSQLASASNSKGKPAGPSV